MTRAATQPRLGYTLRVAAIATLIIAIVYVAAMAVVNVVVAGRLLGQVDTQLSDTLGDAAHGSRLAGAVLPDRGGDRDPGSLPILLWRITAAGHTLESTLGAPRVPATAWPHPGEAETVTVGRATFRLTASQAGRDRLVAGQNLADTQHLERVLLTTEAVAAPVLLAAVFLGTLVIGLRASAPVEQARRRQLEFTADASHELRTPLSVIEAETGLALSLPRNTAQYQDALRRVSGESHRLRRIVDDLLWLARFDSAPASPDYEPVDVFTIAEICADRFAPVARSRGIDLSAQCDGDPQAWITAPPEWVDRLAGVLVDNACRYAGTGPDGAGRASPKVKIVTAGRGSRVSLTVEDSGPGIPLDKRAHLFDRFYRATGQEGGSGLGLAIADAIVNATGGKWRVDDSPLGGTRMQVTWHRARHRQHAGQSVG